MFRFQLLARLALRLLEEPSLPAGTIAGVRVRVHPSALFAVAIVWLAVSRHIAPLAVPEGSGTLAFGGALAALAFGSLAFREIARAAARGAPDRRQRVTLYLLGAAVRGRAPDSPGGEVRAALAGLGTSLGLALAYGAVWLIAVDQPPLAPLAVGAAFLAATNLMILSLQACPAFPLDGGRLLRAALWRSGGDRARATWIASRHARWAALLMIATGVVASLRGSGLGLLLVLVGWFVGESAHRKAAAVLPLLVRRFVPDYPRRVSPSPFGPERAGNIQVTRPRSARTKSPGAPASAPKDPPVQSGDPEDSTSSSAGASETPLTGTDQTRPRKPFHPA